MSSPASAPRSATGPVICWTCSRKPFRGWTSVPATTRARGCGPTTFPRPIVRRASAPPRSPANSPCSDSGVRRSRPGQGSGTRNRRKTHHAPGIRARHPRKPRTSAIPGSLPAGKVLRPPRGPPDPYRPIGKPSPGGRAADQQSSRRAEGDRRSRRGASRAAEQRKPRPDDDRPSAASRSARRHRGDPDPSGHSDPFRHTAAEDPDLPLRSTPGVPSCHDVGVRNPPTNRPPISGTPGATPRVRVRIHDPTTRPTLIRHLENPAASETPTRPRTSIRGRSDATSPSVHAATDPHRPTNLRRAAATATSSRGAIIPTHHTSRPPGAAGRARNPHRNRIFRMTARLQRRARPARVLTSRPIHTGRPSCRTTPTNLGRAATSSRGAITPTHPRVEHTARRMAPEIGAATR